MAANSTNKHKRRLLEPMDRIAEVFCGVLMVLTFTLTINKADAGRETVREMLIAALGCNLAWGLIDGALYVLGSLSRSRKNALSVNAVRTAPSPDSAYQVIADAVPPFIAQVLTPGDLESLRARLADLPKAPARSLTMNDWLGGLGVFLLVFLSTWPVVIPFIFMSNVARALRVSNAIAIVLLFLIGYRFGHVSGSNPWRSGFAMVGVGLVLVVAALVLGG
jgi:VIT1/CCC1 family predicted Fe2+/Mn2+ transporter